MNKNTTKVTIEGKEYTLNLDKALQAGLIEEVFNPVYPLDPGDVYVSSESAGGLNSFLLVEVTYSFGKEDARYQLLGIGCECTSNEFFRQLHSLKEISAYLKKKKMVYQRNISREVMDLVNKEAK